jgi:Protein of unknown function (DUF3995)
MFFALPIALIFSGRSLLHIYWTAGGKWGGDAAIPSLPVAMTATEPGCTRDEPEMVKALTPGEAKTLSVAGALALVALLVVLHAGLLGPAASHWALRWSLGAVVFVMLARAVEEFRLMGFCKTATGAQSARMDRWYCSPVCVTRGLALAWIAAH